MRLIISHLPVGKTEYADDDETMPTSTSVMRHWLTYDDGRIYFQDETIKSSDGVMLSSTRTEWSQLPTPPMTDQVAGTFEYGGLPGVVTRSGKAYLWAAKSPASDEQERAFRLLEQGHRVNEWQHQWIPFAEPVPGTPAAEFPTFETLL